MYQIITYNTNHPTECTEIISDGVTVSLARMAQIKDECGNGPYFGFLRKEPTSVFRFRGPYNGIKPFFILDSTGISADSDMLGTHKKVMSTIKEKETLQPGGKK